jgi:ABC-2 type transport system ATP-binding protein
MRQRLGLAQALLPRPELVLLDEPTNGLDPEGIAEMRVLIQRLNRELGFTVLFCSHLLSEVEHLCDRVAILNEGRLIYSGYWQELRPKGARFRIEAEPQDKVGAFLDGATVIGPGLFELAPETDIAECVSRMVQAGLRVRAVVPEKQTLEQLYLREIHRP